MSIKLCLNLSDEYPNLGKNGPGDVGPEGAAGAAGVTGVGDVGPEGAAGAAGATGVGATGVGATGVGATGVGATGAGGANGVTEFDDAELSEETP
jgi:hypothetical protein